MQVVIQVTSSKSQSLRKKIANDPKVGEFNLLVSEQKQMGRRPGWMKMHSISQDRHGAINIEWDEPSRTLRCRVVTRGHGKPHYIVGDFVTYLLARFHSHIQSINIS